MGGRGERCNFIDQSTIKQFGVVIELYFLEQVNNLDICIVSDYEDISKDLPGPMLVLA